MHSSVVEKVAKQKVTNSYEELWDVVTVLQRLQCIFRGQLPNIHRHYVLNYNWSSSLRQNSTALSFRLNWKRSELYFSKFQRVPPALPVIPHHTIIVRRRVDAGVVVVAVQVAEVAVMTVAVPPATFEPHCTRAAWPLVVVLVSSAELVSKMISQWITFTQQVENWHVSQKSSIVSVYSC